MHANSKLFTDLQSEAMIPNQHSFALNFFEYRVLAETRIPLKLVLWGVRVVAQSVHTHKYTQLNQTAVFKLVCKLTRT